MPLLGADSKVRQWYLMSYQALTLPPLGTTALLEMELGRDLHLFSGVKYQLPSTAATGDTDAYEHNRLTLTERLEQRGWISATRYWIASQRSFWNYKQLKIGLEGDDLGYVNSGYTGEALFPKMLHLLGLGAYRNIDQLRSLKFDFYGMDTYGLRLRSLVLTEMGYEYASSRQYINDFIDEANLTSEDFDIRMRATIKRSLTLSGSQEFLRRIQLKADDLGLRRDVVTRLIEEQRQQDRRRGGGGGYPRERPRSAPVPRDMGSPEGRFGPGYNPQPTRTNDDRNCGSGCFYTRP